MCEPVCENFYDLVCVMFLYSHKSRLPFLHETTASSSFIDNPATPADSCMQSVQDRACHVVVTIPTILGL